MEVGGGVAGGGGRFQGGKDMDGGADAPLRALEHGDDGDDESLVPDGVVEGASLEGFDLLVEEEAFPFGVEIDASADRERAVHGFVDVLEPRRIGRHGDASQEADEGAEDGRHDGFLDDGEIGEARQDGKAVDEAVQGQGVVADEDEGAPARLFQVLPACHGMAVPGLDDGPTDERDKPAEQIGSRQEWRLFYHQGLSSFVRHAYFTILPFHSTALPVAKSLQALQAVERTLTRMRG